MAYILATPIRKLDLDDCSVFMNKSDEAVCPCSGGGDHPPENVTWFQGKLKIGGGRKKQMLGLKKVYRGKNGTYQCVKKNYDLEKNQTFIELNVNCKYTQIVILFNTEFKRS